MLLDITGLQINQRYTVDLNQSATDLAGNPLLNLTSYNFLATVDEHLDTDQDGMPDIWEFLFGLDPYDPSDRDEDKDEDGHTNYEEYMGYSDPTDPSSLPLKSGDETSTLHYWWLVPILIALLITSIIFFIMLMGERKEEPKGPVEQVEDIYLAMRAQKDIKVMEELLAKEESTGENINEAEIMVRKAKEAFEKGDYNVITVYVQTLKDLVGQDMEGEDWEEDKKEEEEEGEEEEVEAQSEEDEIDQNEGTQENQDEEP